MLSFETTFVEIGLVNCGFKNCGCKSLSKEEDDGIIVCGGRCSCVKSSLKCNKICKCKGCCTNNSAIPTK